ncbi:TetR/AcrR family transcriptional regulator [Devosia sp. LjRoot3]|uniref:TetR/AcrR family transcriptional regulator n=1 Tax=Devosia sp. LjRoot3 TaxID=3342319 RepID=UPI003ED04EFF
MNTTDKKFRRRAEARPDEMLDAALAVFAEKGFAATKVDEVARRAGVSKGTVYLYFPSKEALMEGIVRRAVAPIAERAVPDMAQFEGDPRLPIAMLVHTLQNLLSDPNNLAVPRLILREIMNFPAIAELYRREVLGKVIPALTALVARGVASGQLRKIDPEMTVRSIVGPIVAHVALSEVFGMRPEEGLALDRLVENHLDILFHGISPAGGEETP